MFAVALLASLLAQAEQAPAPAAPASSAASGPAEAAPAPLSPVVAPAPPTPAAPAPLPPIVAEPAPSPPANGVAVYVRYAYRVDAAGDPNAPTTGLSVGGEFERRFLTFASGTVEVGGAVDFFYDRFAKDVIAASLNPTTGASEPMIVTQTLSQTTFSLLGTAAWRYADMRLFVGAGGGLAVGYFSGVTNLAVSNTDLLPMARGVFGFDFAIAARTSAVLRVDYSHTFDRNSYFAGANGALYPMFGDLFDAGIGLLLRF